MQRVLWLDGIRAVAIILVLFTHVHECFGLGHGALEGDNTVRVLEASFCYAVSRNGVPFFLMISGALLLARDVSNKHWYEAIRLKRILDFIFLAFLYCVVTNIIEQIINGSELKNSVLLALIKNNILLGNVGYGIQFWFIGAIIPLYLSIPFLQLYLKNSKNLSGVTIYAACTVILFLLLPNSLRNHSLLKIMDKGIFSVYVLYFVIGYISVTKSEFINIMNTFLKKYFFIIPFTVLFVMGISLFHPTYHRQLTWYATSFSILIISTVSFSLLKQYFTAFNWNKHPAFTQGVLLLAKYSWGMFLSHYIFLWILKKYSWRSGIAGVDVLINLIILILISFGYVHLMEKSKYTRWLVS